MDTSEVFFVISACAAAFIIGVSYIDWLRDLGLYPGESGQHPSWIKWGWFVVWIGFILGLAFILV